MAYSAQKFIDHSDQKPIGGMAYTRFGIDLLWARNFFKPKRGTEESKKR
jgi:hypothetical protein